MRLNEFQEQFKDLMLDHPDALQNPPEDLAGVFVSGDIPLAERLSVYRSNVVGNLSDVIVGSFPVLEALVGKEFLSGMARGFVLKHPPERACLHYYGGGFADFIAGFGPAKDLPYLPDVARFEQALGLAYYGDDDAPMRADGLSRLAPEDLGGAALCLRDSVHLIASPYPLEALRDYCLEGAGAKGDAPDMNVGDVCTLMVYRPAYSVEIVKTAPDEHMMLKSLQGGRVLGDAVEAVLSIYEDFDFAEFLQKHIALETFLAFEANE